MFAGIQVLEREASRLADTVIINLVQINFSRRVVQVMLVRRITRPITAGRVNLDDHELISREIRADDVDNLARGIAAAAEAADHLPRSNQLGVESSIRGSTAFRNFAGTFAGELRAMAG